MEKHLEFLFKNVTDWLKFAEAKNGALLAFNAAVILGVLKVYSDLETPGTALSVYIAMMIVFLGLSSLACLLSFIPKLNIPWLFQKHDQAADFNVIFFGHVAHASPKFYIQKLAENLGEKVPENAYFEQLAGQIIANSKIALFKFRIFTFAIILTICGLVSPILALLIHLTMIVTEDGAN